MIDVTRHALERYIERILGIKATTEAKEELIRGIGGQIQKTLNDMVRNNDLFLKTGGRDNEISETYLVLYRNIAIIINNYHHESTSSSGLKITTLYKISQPDVSESEYYKYINYIKKQIEKLENEFVDLNFKGASNRKRAIKKRIEQYRDLLFYNPIAIYGGGNKEEEK